MLLAAAAVSCGTTSAEPDVEFLAGDPVGSWQVSDNAGDASVSADSAVTHVPNERVAAQTNAAGRAASPPTPSAADGGTNTESAAGAEAPAPEGTGATSLTMQLTTSAVGGRYQPKNIGAIWIEGEAGGVVKTLKVWAGTRRRYLTGYAAALAGSAVDVTASATLSRHQTHTVSWDLKDRSGASVAPGVYRIRMELTDSNQTGRSNVIEVDTSQGPRTLTPADAPSFSAIKLELK